MRKMLASMLLASMLAGCGIGGIGGGDTTELDALIQKIQAACVTTCHFLASSASVEEMIKAAGGPIAVVVSDIAHAVCSVVTAHAAPAGEPKKVTVIINGKEVEVDGTFVE